MALKLLNPAVAAQKQKDREARDNAQILNTQGTLARKLRELADAEASFDDVLQRQRNQWAAEEQEHHNHLVDLHKKVVALEERRKAALVPLTARGKELENVSSALVLREQKVSQKEKDLEERVELLEQKLDDVGDREQQANLREVRLAMKEEGVKAQADEVVLGSRALTASIEDSNKTYRERYAQLDEIQRALKAQELSIQERERVVAERENSFAERERALRDKYATLERSTKRIHGTSSKR